MIWRINRKDKKLLEITYTFYLKLMLAANSGFVTLPFVLLSSIVFFK